MQAHPVSSSKPATLDIIWGVFFNQHAAPAPATTTPAPAALWHLWQLRGFLSFRHPVFRVEVELSLLDNFILDLILRPAKAADAFGGGGREECAEEGEGGEGGEDLHRGLRRCS